MADTQGRAAPGAWSFDDIPKSRPTEADEFRQRKTGTAQPEPSSQQSSQQQQEQQQKHQQSEQKSWKPRTCRICLETVHPTFPSFSEHIPSMFQSAPKPVYVSEDCGRLIRPCKCKGSQRYVHEGCLQEWRFADTLNKRNYWHCPTCGYQYTLTRMTWARWISSQAMQVFLTSLVFLVAIFVLGFVADPIINMYVDPLGSVAGEDPASVVRYIKTDAGYELYVDDEDDLDATWFDHFIKGFGALGVLGFVKVLFTMSPLNLFNIRGNFFFGGGGGRPGGTGRDRVANIAWPVLLLGALTFLYTVWKAVRALSKRLLEKASQRVLDVPLAPGEKEDDD